MLHVPVIRLDDRFGPHEPIAFIKIDVEGAEHAALRGAERILTEQRPVLLFESEQRHLGGGDVRDGFETLHRLGYRGWFFHRGALRPVAEFDAQIAAIAKTRGFAVVTRNARDFEHCGIQVIDPWSDPPA